MHWQSSEAGDEERPSAYRRQGRAQIVPLLPEAERPAARIPAHHFCRTLAKIDPQRFTVALPKRGWRGRILLDYLRAPRRTTAVLPYSVRERTPAACGGVEHCGQHACESTPMDPR